MPDSAAQRPMKQAMAQSELDCMRTSNAGKPKQAISPREKARPRQATAAGGVRRNRMEGEEAKGSGDGSLQGEGSREGPAESLEAAFEAVSSHLRSRPSSLMIKTSSGMRTCLYICRLWGRGL